MPDWALLASEFRGSRTNQSLSMPNHENGGAKRHVETLRSKIAFHDINKGDYKL